MAGNAHAPGRSVTSRALDLLGTFDTQHVRQNLSQIARRAGMPVPTCYRLLRDLAEWGAVARGEDGTYTIGPRLAQLGLLAPLERGLRQTAAPYMQDVLFATRQIVNLFVLDGTEALLLDRIAGTRVGSPIARPGDRLPLHTSAAGKVLLAHGPAELVEAAAARLTPETRYSIADRPRLEAELELVRERGYATTEGEHSSGAYGLAVPIRGAEGEVIAALGIVSLARITDFQRIVPALQVASAAISRSLTRAG
ncbi:IclR family transcriptional regulator [Citricoccus sp. SGAir0253]|uniref:IclR family transcriptional regulator n=1 Tax=Citricoccus sp. SGAir0253 TaxID=2567881 RepID=UPI0010CD364E|nr:IclR family transcriptional regulator [Citricoccus sp. SGAir0253]QCU77181.1 IclR family transcriptional regulator [Citricoccus sp. SGAir0253]